MRALTDSGDVSLSDVQANGLRIRVAIAGEGPPVLLLHGWPHTWLLWRKIIPTLARQYRVIAPDLRGLGDTSKAASGYDLYTLADDAAALLAALKAPAAIPVGIDAGSPVAWMLAMRHPERVRKLVMMESLLGALPGAEGFLSRGAPWWFAFHAVPGLAETVLVGNEAAYLDWFFVNGTAGGRGIDPQARDAFVRAYSGREALRCGFEYYRAFPRNNQEIAEMVNTRRLTVPTLAVGGGVVGDALYKQLRPITDDLTGHIVPDCGHLIPEEQPQALLDVLLPFLRPA